MIPAPIETERLVIQVLDLHQAEMLRQFVVRNIEHLSQWEPSRPPAYYTLKHCVERIASHRKIAEVGLGFQLHILHKAHPDLIVGFCNFNNVVRGAFQSCYLGYALDKNFTGQGLMHETLTAGIRYMFEQEKLHRIMANYVPTNARSAAVLRQLGFEVEGLAKSYLHIDGAWRDHVLTSLINTKPTL